MQSANTVGPVPIYKSRLTLIQSTVDGMWFRITTKICSNSDLLIVTLYLEGAQIIAMSMSVCPLHISKTMWPNFTRYFACSFCSI